MDVHLRNLRYFVAVAEELHFSRAAERLHVSQPALSKQIRQLEQQLRFPLFRRDRRRVELTAAGEALLPRARRLLAAWDASLAEAGTRASDEARLLRVGFQTSVAGGLYQAVFARFGELHRRAVEPFVVATERLEAEHGAPLAIPPRPLATAMFAMEK